ncbi:hypothetical protein ABZ464_47840 [Streptomyces sp. NPDC005820]|uniref:hypothetical protein n=1 Tax=Streptomyces sp. NPDC005820 TaxID=3157069 RepID=UPI0033FD88DF
MAAWPDGEHACEGLGPRVQGNPLRLDGWLCVPFNLEVPVYEAAPRSYEGLREFLAELESRYAPGSLAEGIVFHHPGGRRAKIKRKDFPKGPDARPAGRAGFLRRTGSGRSPAGPDPRLPNRPAGDTLCDRSGR